MGRHIFLSARGDEHNPGDTALRRAQLRALRRNGELHVFVDLNDGYRAGLDLHDSDTVYRDRDTWRRTLARASTSRHFAYAFNAGEIQFSPAYARRYVRLAPILAASKPVGGRAVHTGFGIRRAARVPIGIMAALGACDLVSWRDELSRSAARRGVTAPDWAFAEGTSSHPVPGSTLVIAPRVDSQLAPDTIDGIVAFAEEVGLEPVVVAQTRSDATDASALATRIGTRLSTWTSDDHTEQEHRLREVYGAARIVLSQRLHALVFAATEGSVPVALEATADGKARRTLTAAGLPDLFIAPDATRLAIATSLTAALASSHHLPDTIAAARQRIDRLADDITTVLA